MSDFQEFVKDAMSAPPERLAAARRLLKGELPKPEPYLTLRGLSRQIGFGVTTLRRWRVPSHDLGGFQRYRLSEVEAYLASKEFQRRQAALRAERRRQRTCVRLEFGDGLNRPGRRQPITSAGMR